MTAIAELQTRLVQIELEMLAMETPEAVAALRPARDRALEQLRAAEERARAEPALAWGGFGQSEPDLEELEEPEVERPMTREERLEKQRMLLLCWRRSTMTDRQKRRCRARHGLAFYKSIPY